MSIGYNHVELVGRIVQAPIYKDLGDKKIITFTIAIPKSPKSDNTDFIPCIAWDSVAEFIYNYFDSGDLVLVDGKLDQRKWVDEDGYNRQKLQVKVNNVYFMETKKSKQLRNEQKNVNAAYDDIKSDTSIQGFANDMETILNRLIENPHDIYES